MKTIDWVTPKKKRNPRAWKGYRKMVIFMLFKRNFLCFSDHSHRLKGEEERKHFVYTSLSVFGIRKKLYLINNKLKRIVNKPENIAAGSVTFFGCDCGFDGEDEINGNS